MEIQNILDERGRTHGSFDDNAMYMIAILRAKGILPPTSNLPDTVLCMMIMDSSKDARILSGDHEYLDNYVDKAGYSTLMIERLQPNETSITS